MTITPEKPVRPTEINFSNKTDFINFYNYINKKELTNEPTLNRVREELNSHKRSSRRVEK